MKHRPLQKYLLLEVKQFEPTGSIFIPEHARKKRPIGTVIDVGSCVTEAKKNDVIFFKKSGTKKISKNLVICPEWNIICDYNWINEIVKNKHKIGNK